jgi:hypothetical protein
LARSDFDMMNPIHLTKTPEVVSDNGAWLEIVRKHVASLRHGAVEIVIHEGRVVEIKKSERVRLGNTETAGASQPVSSKAEDSVPKPGQQT